MPKNLIIFLILILSACSAVTDCFFATYPSPNSYFNRFLENKKSIIIVKLISSYDLINWCTSSDIEGAYQQCFSIKPSPYYQIIMLPASKYEIAGYESASNINRPSVRSNKKFEIIFSNITGKRKNLPFLSFNSWQDQIIYLGEIKYHYQNSITQILDDDYELMKNAFLKNDEKTLNSLFGHHLSEMRIVHKFMKENPNLLIKDLAQTKSDLLEEKKYFEIQTKKKKTQKKQDQLKLKILKLKNYEKD